MSLPSSIVTLRGALVAALLAPASLIAASQQDPSPRERPNLLIVVTDDQRFDHMGCAGHPFLQTPTMDRLAARGTRFLNAFVTTAICAASRASILTSKHECSHGYTFGKPPLSRAHAEDSYPALLRGAGYTTGFCGKFGIRAAEGVTDAMFDSFRPRNLPYAKKGAAGEPVHLTDRVADDAMAFLDGARGHGPFCLSVSFWAPHAEDNNPDQYVWPAALDGLYDDQPVPRPPLSEPAFFDGLPPLQRESLNRVRWKWRFDTEEKRVAMTRAYCRMITGVDRALGRILDHLEAIGSADNTVVVFTSDNGYFLGERGFAGKWTAHDLSMRVPLIVYDPRRPGRGVAAEEMVLNLDLGPTLLELAGVAVPETFEGRSLAPLLAADPIERPAWRRETYYEHGFEHAKIPRCRGVRTLRWKYARSVLPDPELHPGDVPVEGLELFEELYDLASDPLEAHNLAGDPGHRPVLDALRRRTAALEARYRAPR